MMKFHYSLDSAHFTIWSEQINGEDYIAFHIFNFLGFIEDYNNG